jgi:beta-lactamase class D
MKLIVAALALPAAAQTTICTAIAEAATGKVVKQEGTCDLRMTPASTFKIALSLMGHDAGYLTDEHLPALPFREGYADWDPSWRNTTDPTSWIKNSVVAWLSSSLKISPLEQLAFLEKIVNRQLPVSARAIEMTSRITSLGTLPNGWEVHGKAGTGTLNAGGSDHSIGWFTGWATKGARTFVFARCIQDDKPQPIRTGLRARDTFMQQLPAILDSL